MNPGHASNNNHRTIAYFSMEVGLDSQISTYSGGLGALAGDTIRSAADLCVPMVAVTLLHRKGYFYQRLDGSGWQQEDPVSWPVNDFLTELPQRASVRIQDRDVRLRAWQYEVEGVSGFRVPVYFLDAALPENAASDQTFTDSLYGGDDFYRFCQEVILGIGGVRMLRALGHDHIQHFHMNEGHAGLLTVELLEELAHQAGREQVTREDIDAVRERCVFTTHTPVPAGHDQFSMEIVTRALGQRPFRIDLSELTCGELMQRVFHSSHAFHSMAEVFQGPFRLNMTYLALNLSGYVNGVAKKHGEVSRHLFGDYEIDAITNGVHAVTWTSPPFQRLFDQFVPGWRQDNFSLRSALSIPAQEVWKAHLESKRVLLARVNHETNAGMDVDLFTLGFARRATAYKRWTLLFQDVDRLRSIAARYGPLQVVFAGKAHPKDQQGKELIRQIVQLRDKLNDPIRIAYLVNYDLELAKLMTAGVDVWLNTPLPPLEASGTSGMKAALNGVPHLSVLDGWWDEGHIEGVTGWSIGERDSADRKSPRTEDAAALYDKLNDKVMPAYYADREGFLNVMRHAIALNGSFFNTQRMMQQYVLNAYFHG